VMICSDLNFFPISFKPAQRITQHLDRFKGVHHYPKQLTSKPVAVEDELATSSANH